MTYDLKPYPVYKDAGVPWLAQVPEHWSLLPNRALLRRRKILVGERHTEYRLLSLTKEGVIVRDVESGKGKFSADMGTCQEVRARDLVFCLFDVPETPRTVGLSHHDGMITGAYTVFECSDSALSAFLDLFYRAMDDRKLLSPLYSGLRKTIPPSRFLGTKTPVPPPTEQATIVRFLDYVNRSIRRYIRAKQKLIKLLEEQKQAIIHRAVTRGLDPNVCLKSSGVEWLGDVPEHWQIVPLKRIAWFKGGSGFPVHEQGGVGLEIPFLKVSDMNRGGNERRMETATNTVSRETAARLGACVFPGDAVVFPKVGGALLTNKRRLLTRPSCIDNNMMGCVILRGNRDYIFMLLEWLDLGRLAKPGPVPAISEGEVREIKVALPPIGEQEAIVERVKEETRPYTLAITVGQREIEIAREYRTCLIADVVTGKFDVREAAAQLPGQTEAETLEEESAHLGEEETSEDEERVESLKEAEV